MVEYRHDPSTGRCCLMEINGRFWGSLQLAIDAGVDFVERFFVHKWADYPQARPDCNFQSLERSFLPGETTSLVNRVQLW